MNIENLIQLGGMGVVAILCLNYILNTKTKSDGKMIDMLESICEALNIKRSR